MLASSLAWAALTLSGCSDNGGSGGTGGTGGGGGTGGSGAGGSGTLACGGTNGNGAGGAAGTGGSAFACMNTMTGTHTHPLTIPGSDIENGNSMVPYTLQDCGTGHTHTIELSVYDVAFLQAGTTVMVDSSTTASHLHTVSISCTMS